MKKKAKEQKEKKVEVTVLDYIKQARLSSKPRGFVQTWDFCINVRGLDLKKPTNRFNLDVVLPKGRGKEPKVLVFADAIAPEAQKIADVVVRKEEIVGITKNKARMDDIMGCDIFLGEASLMTMVGKELGPVLAPKGKMPRLIPQGTKLDQFIAASKKSMRIGLKESPTIHVAIGNEKMPDADIAANAEAIFSAVRDRLPKGLNNVRSVVIKLTMGKPIKMLMK